MKIVKELNNKQLVLSLEGELNTVTAPEFEEVIKNELNNVDSLIVDLAKLSYLSSAGLRVLLVAQKIMMNQGEMKLVHVSDLVMEILDVTGFVDILTIE